MAGLSFLVASIGIHLFILFGLEKATHLFHTPENDPVEITIVENGRRRMHVNSQPSPHALDLKPQNARFASEKDQVVKQETRAPNLKYQNATSSVRQSALNQNDQKDQTESDSDSTAQRLRNLGNNILSQMPSDTSALDFIKEGNITSLNTERNVYFSFFNRVDQQVSSQWIANLKDYELRLTENDMRRLGGKNWTTVLEVILDGEGHYKKHIVHQSSGDLPLDLAAINSFLKTAYFPNPPKDMIKDDGTVRLYYGFIVKTPPARRWAKDRS